LPEGGEMVWLEGVGLGIGCVRNELYDWRREWLYWYDRDGVRYPTAKEQAAIAEASSEQERFARRRAEAIADQERISKERAKAAGRILQGIAEQANLDKQQAEAIANQERNEKLQERLAKEQAEQKAQRLAEMLRSLGINPDEM
jgi:hypothetical protein